MTYQDDRIVLPGEPGYTSMASYFVVTPAV